MHDIIPKFLEGRFAKKLLLWYELIIGIFFMTLAYEVLHRVIYIKFNQINQQ